MNHENDQAAGLKKLVEKIKDIKSLSAAYDALISGLYDNRPLPGGITDSKFIRSLGYGAAYNIYVTVEGQLIQRQLFAFHVVKNILDQMANFRAGINAKKLALFSGHDTNLFAILAAFGLITDVCLIANYN
ncbi:MAG: hypothetical protein EOO07_35765, partial [Chitinophagaceae bacterium]